MRKIRYRWLAVSLLITTTFFTLSQCRQSSPIVVVESEPEISSLISTFITSNGYNEIPFPEVIESATGKLIIAFDPNDQVDRQILTDCDFILTKLFKEANSEGSKISQLSRLVEVERSFEDKLIRSIEEIPELSCDYARTGTGTIQRSGYPDLKLIHEPSGRVIYLSHKFVKEGTLDSSLNSFYYSPKETSESKIHSDAIHLLIGIIHNGKSGGKWKFSDRKLVDLSQFKVRLKAEFQASNKDVYLPELTIDPKTLLLEE